MSLTTPENSEVDCGCSRLKNVTLSWIKNRLCELGTAPANSPIQILSGLRVLASEFEVQPAHFLSLCKLV